MKNKKAYCTQNNGDCKSCSLTNYGRDCENIKIDREVSKKQYEESK